MSALNIIYFLCISTNEGTPRTFEIGSNVFYCFGLVYALKFLLNPVLPMSCNGCLCYLGCGMYNMKPKFQSNDIS